MISRGKSVGELWAEKEIRPRNHSTFGNHDFVQTCSPWRLCMAFCSCEDLQNA